MSYSVDVSVLVYASDASSPFHAPATDFLRKCAEDSTVFYLLWPVIIGYLRVSTHPSIFAQPLAPEDALGNVEGLLGWPQVRLLGPTADAWPTFKQTFHGQVLRGNLVPDTYIAALLRHHGVRLLYTHDRDFRRFDFLDTRSPFS